MAETKQQYTHPEDLITPNEYTLVKCEVQKDKGSNLEKKFEKEFNGQKSVSFLCNIIVNGKYASFFCYENQVDLIRSGQILMQPYKKKNKKGDMVWKYDIKEPMTDDSLTNAAIKNAKKNIPAPENDDGFMESLMKEPIAKPTAHNDLAGLRGGTASILQQDDIQTRIVHGMITNNATQIYAAMIIKGITKEDSITHAVETAHVIYKLANQVKL